MSNQCKEVIIEIQGDEAVVSIDGKEYRLSGVNQDSVQYSQVGFIQAMKFEFKDQKLS